MLRSSNDALRVLGDSQAEVGRILAKYPNDRSATLPLLFLVQSIEGYATEDGMRDVAAILNLTPAEVLGVASFYTMLKKTPQGEYLVSVCRNISCTHRGGRKVLSALEDHLGVRAGEMTSDGRFSLEAAECLATCDGAPAIQLNYEDFYDVTPADAVRLVGSLEKGEPVTSVAGQQVKTAKEIARETALAGAGHDLGDMGDMPVVGGEAPLVKPGTRPPVKGFGAEEAVEGGVPDG
jgi:NADH-quinone oxidoreductase subunit E